MQLSMAPMEGLTGYMFRRVHASCFGALDRYYTPFLPPARVGSTFGGRARKEIAPEHNEGLNVVPQLLTKSADEFVWAAGIFAGLGYTEVNLNLGCPSGTVVAKGKGAGALRDLDELAVFLRDICERSPLPISIKTRTGVADDDAFDQILALYKTLPLKELIVHPRAQKDRYEGIPRRERFAEALAQMPFPVAYSGDIFCPDDMNYLVEAYPQTTHVMLGRGLLANPALARTIAGGPALTLDELKRFHDELFGAYMEEMGGNAVFRMKEWWSYVRFAFTDPLAVHRAVRKARKVEAYEAGVAQVFATGRLSSEPWFPAADRGLR